MRLALFAALAMPAALAAQPAAIAPLTQADDGRTIHLATGSDVVVRLERSGGTAYAWQMRRAPGIRLVGQPVSVDRPHAPGSVGAPVVQVFHLRMASADSAVARFDLVAQTADHTIGKRVSFTFLAD